MSNGCIRIMSLRTMHEEAEALALKMGFNHNHSYKYNIVLSPSSFLTTFSYYIVLEPVFRAHLSFVLVTFVSPRTHFWDTCDYGQAITNSMIKVEFRGLYLG